MRGSRSESALTSEKAILGYSIKTTTGRNKCSAKTTSCTPLQRPLKYLNREERRKLHYKVCKLH